MGAWWKRKKEQTRKHRKLDGRNTFGDFLMDVLFWLPEVIVIPFRLLFCLFWGIRSIWRYLDLI